MVGKRCTIIYGIGDVLSSEGMISFIYGFGFFGVTFEAYEEKLCFCGPRMYGGDLDLMTEQVDPLPFADSSDCVFACAVNVALSIYFLCSS
jgi:hypothetical protein